MQLRLGVSGITSIGLNIFISPQLGTSYTTIIPSRGNKSILFPRSHPYENTSEEREPMWKEEWSNALRNITERYHAVDTRLFISICNIIW